MTQSASLAAAVTRLTGFAADPLRADVLAERIAPVIAACRVRDAEDLAVRLRLGDSAFIRREPKDARIRDQDAA